MLGDSLIKHENTIYIYNQKSTQFGAVYVPLPGRWYCPSDGILLYVWAGWERRNHLYSIL